MVRDSTIIIDEGRIINFVIAAQQYLRKRKRIRVNDIGLFRYRRARIHFPRVNYDDAVIRHWKRCVTG